MDYAWTQDLLNWLSQNPGWAGALVFMVACVESLVLIGIMVPGIVILFGIGAMIGLGAIEFTPVWFWGSLGAFLGDAFSYGVGHRYREHLVDIWPFSRYPAMLERGTRFFRKHGAKSVIAGRFIGPLRPVIPATAGMLGMRPGRFISIDVPASIIWAPAYLLPGMLFGASLEMASEYAGRLTLVLIILVVVLWLTFWVIWATYTYLAGHSARWLARSIRYTRRHPVFGRIAGPLLDPSQPELLSVSMLGLLLVITIWSLALILFLSPFEAQPEALDQAVLAQAQALRNHIADPAMVAISQLSRWWVLLPTSAAVLLWLMGAGRYNAAGHWLVAMGGGVILHFMLVWTLRATPFLQETGAGELYAPSAALTLTAVVLGFFSVMVARELRRENRKWPYLATALLLALLLLSRLYLGLDWLSGALVGLLLGFTWTAIVGIAYRQRAFRPFSGVIASVIFFGVLSITLTWQVEEQLQEDMASLKLPLPGQVMQAQSWWDGEWSLMPEFRTRFTSVAAREFNFQIAAEPEAVASALTSNGWEIVGPADWTWLMQALNPEPDEDSLPLLGKDYLGHREVLLLKQPGVDGTRQMTFRIWDSGARLQPGDQPLYLGQISEEVLVRRLRLLSHWRALPAKAIARQQLIRELEDFETKLETGGLLLVRTTGQPGNAATFPTVSGASSEHR
jgi:membrane protein DedA with SNARE-associated domain/membrane-associated phospholipid phosphatase